jgi:DNA-binding NtrC family response regulator
MPGPCSLEQVSLGLDGEPGAGTTIHVDPPSVERAAPAPAASRTKLATQGGTEMILLVEDDDQVRKLTLNILRRAGYDALEACNPDEALFLCEQPGASIDLLLSDVIMPKMSGPQLASLVEALRPGIRTLFMSGYTDDRILNHGVLDARAAFLQKPFTSETLTKKIREVLDSPIVQHA